MKTNDWTKWVLNQTGAERIGQCAILQNLWGGYGELLRIGLEGCSTRSVILKQVVLPSNRAETISYCRKKRSYEVEQAWYADGSRRCSDSCRVARCFGIENFGSRSFLLLEDLNTAGFYLDRAPRLTRVHSGLSWLAHFHSLFLGVQRPELWEFGTYWHLDTRPEEWEKMPAGRLKDGARTLDLRLKSARYQTLVHGDAKPPNFCWDEQDKAAAVDFQYVGRGCGIRDVALFIGRNLGEQNLEQKAAELLACYFQFLHQAVAKDGHEIDVDDLEKEWRELYPVAWSDYARFGLGWGKSPTLSSYSQGQVDLALGPRR